MLVTDYRMEGMDGVELAKLVRRKAPGPSHHRRERITLRERCDDGQLRGWKKQDMFPALLDKIKFLLGEGEAQAEPEERLSCDCALRADAGDDSAAARARLVSRRLLHFSHEAADRKRRRFRIDARSEPRHCRLPPARHRILGDADGDRGLL